jgi:hypothetical protein
MGKETRIRAKLSPRFGTAPRTSDFSPPVNRIGGTTEKRIHIRKIVNVALEIFKNYYCYSIISRHG